MPVPFTSPLLNPRSRNGFTLLEATVVGGLMAFLALLLSATWSGLGRPLVDALTEFRLARESHMAAVSLARDFGGYLPESTGEETGVSVGKGQRAQSKKTPAKTNDSGRAVGRLLVGRSQLWLCFDGGDEPNGVADWARPDTVISYFVEDDRLVRWNQTSQTFFTVAQHVHSLDLKERGNRVEIGLTFRYRKATRSHTLIARDP